MIADMVHAAAPSDIAVSWNESIYTGAALVRKKVL